MKIVKFTVGGMHCSSCEMLVSDSLFELKGVKKVETSSKHGFVKVEYNEKLTNESEIKKVIAKEGYKV